MKRLTSLALSLAILACTATSVSAAKVGEVLDYALHTDIVAQIDGHPLRSYNVNGRTAIVAEDLAKYGFQVTWNGVKRALKVERKMNDEGKPVNPEAYPKFEAEELLAPIGSRAQAILATDIQTYVAREQVEGFNIDGQTLIWFSDLDAYGDVVWDGETRTANLVLGDPMKHSMDNVIQPLLDWAGENAQYQLYSGPYGTLFVGYYNGTPHGTACQMEYVDLAGNRTDIDALLPVYGFGAEYYLAPRSVFINGDQLHFATTLGGSGEHQIRVDLTQGILADTKPASQSLRQWSFSCQLDSEQETQPENSLDITLTKLAGENKITVLEQSIPYTGVKVQISQSKIVLVPGHSNDPDFEKYPFGRACRALVRSDIPSVYQGEITSNANTEAQRNLVKKFFYVTYNGKMVKGNLWWTSKGGSPAMQFDFDYPVVMKDGDELNLWVGAKN